MPNNDQIQSAVRWLLTISGPIGAYLIARGITAEALTTVVTAIIAICGAIPPIISVIWGITAHSDKAKIEAVEAMPDVKEIVAVPSPDPKSAVAIAIDNPKLAKVVAG